MKIKREENPSFKCELFYAKDLALTLSLPLNSFSFAFLTTSCAIKSVCFAIEWLFTAAEAFSWICLSKEFIAFTYEFISYIEVVVL